MNVAVGLVARMRREPVVIARLFELLVDHVLEPSYQHRELLGCELLTGDHRLAGAPGPSCTIRLLQ